MKHIAKKGYTDIVLNKHIDKDSVLEEEYKKENKELTEERIKYLVEERNLYSTVEEVNENNIKDITAVDEIPKGEKVIDGVDIVEDETNKETEAEDEKEENKVIHNTTEKNNNKNTRKNNKKDEQN